MSRGLENVVPGQVRKGVNVTVYSPKKVPWGNIRITLLVRKEKIWLVRKFWRKVFMSIDEKTL